MSLSVRVRFALDSSCRYCDSSSLHFFVSVSHSMRSTLATEDASPCSMDTRSSSMDFIRSCPESSACETSAFFWD